MWIKLNIATEKCAELLYWYSAATAADTKEPGQGQISIQANQGLQWLAVASSGPPVSAPAKHCRSHLVQHFHADTMGKEEAEVECRKKKSMSGLEVCLMTRPGDASCSPTP